MAFGSILIFGCGNMGGAMLQGWLVSGVAPDVFTVVDPALEEAPSGVRLLREVPADEGFEAVLLGVKPQMLGDLAPVIEPACQADTVVFSILAGVELATLAERFPKAKAHVRVMPNLAAALGKSPIALGESGLDDAGRAAVTELMDRLGQAEWLANEELFHLVTALAGSGPAFVYRFIDGLASGAAELGLDPQQAERLALATVEGAAMLAVASPHSPAELARRVASPGGTTQAGLDVLDDGTAMMKLMKETLRAARDRSVEMAAEARQKG